MGGNDGGRWGVWQIGGWWLGIGGVMTIGVGGDR